MKLSTIIERGRFPAPAAAPQALAWNGDKLWMGSRDLRRIYVIDPKKWEVLDEKEPPASHGLRLRRTERFVLRLEKARMTIVTFAGLLPRLAFRSRTRSLARNLRGHISATTANIST